jgi:hypothetical protein
LLVSTPPEDEVKFAAAVGRSSAPAVPMIQANIQYTLLMNRPQANQKSLQSKEFALRSFAEIFQRFCKCHTVDDPREEI